MTVISNPKDVEAGIRNFNLLHDSNHITKHEDGWYLDTCKRVVKIEWEHFLSHGCDGQCAQVIVDMPFSEGIEAPIVNPSTLRRWDA